MRLLLLAAALVAASAAFSLGGFFAKDESMHLHPLSPPETDPRTARAKRQAYQVFVDGDTSVTVDKSGQAETGAWGAWTADQPCSRECGGGVQTEKRQCSGDCTGPSVRYLSCNTEPCPGAGDFRAEQCAKHNDEALDGNYHKWIPYKGKNKCELLCKPENGNFYYKWEEKVVDGTKCDAKSDDICVDGVCLPLGCDGKLGSAKKADKCGVCDGDGSTCKTIEGFFDERNLSPGYHDIIKLPEGATSIKISEARPSGNNLALKNASDHYYLNGNSMIQVEKEVDAAGTVFEYDDSKQESIVAKGPLTEEVTVALLFRKGNKDSAIKYEFSIPLMDVENMYKPGEWSACSVSCGKGVQTRMPYCIDVKSGGRVHDELCDNVNATKPESEKSCETVDCEAEWFTGEWEDCSTTCGEAGQQWRTVYCHQMFADGKRIIVDDGNCTAERPTYNQPCNRFACPEWQAGPWSACSEKCGDAFQYRSVTCRSEKEGEEGKLLPADACPADGDLETQRTCNLGPCEGLTFQTTEWKLCEKCNDTEETREVTCKDTTGRAYPLEKCLVDNTTEIPIDTRSCATVQPCVYEWTTSQWSKCSTECGHGHKTRKVVCSIHQLGDIEIVDEAHCQGEKPDEKEECTNEEKCTGTWYSGPWSECSAECDGGSQSRMTVCLNYDKKPVPEWCDEASQPAEEQECNVDACPTCFDSDFGCCPDNSTFATGEFFAGCSNCSETIFGCCADNVTEATGADSLGCPEYEAPLTEETTEAPADEEEKKDGEEMLESADAVVQEIKEEGSGEAPTECEVTNEEGETAIVECPISNMTMPEEDGELIANATEPEPLHCSKTEFGCCPDWFTPATGKDNEGCETFVLGACNGTQFGCCPDEVTMARGANLEGCGEPSCAASLYGCCKDRKTIAFGPHYAGCERSSFPCELSDFGCCPDGETAALGKNGTGCGENCLTTKFGCCPDGITVARGVHNEGCGCEFSQFGCCPDGKSVAKGVSFFGCPESCAQSKFGCCPDGKTAARGQNKEGCPCQYTRFGCCPDGETTALGPRKEGCDDCRYAKYGCCLDGETKATGKDYQGCPTTTLPPFIVGGTVAPSKIAACAQPQDNGEVCAPGYKLNWYFDTKSGRCEQFWFGGCKGNENRFASKEMCEQICVEPPGKGRCYLPKNNGGEHCNQPVPRYWYDPSTKQCAAFWYRGCGGNANSFANWEDCSTFCKDVEPVTEAPATAAPMPQQQPQQPVEYAPHNMQQQPQPEEAQVIAHEIPDDRQQAPQQPQQPQPQQPVRQTMEEICRQTQDSGPCQSYSDQWFFDAYKGECSTFIYGGCGGNLNRFRTKEECEQRCQQYAVGGARPTGPAPQHTAQPVAQPQAQPVQPAQPIQQQPMHPAHPAQPAQPSQQQPYPYPYPQQQPAAPAPAPARGGGFVSSKSRESCNLPQDIGRCKGSFDSWYHDAASGQCTQFKYSGCGGNANRFHSKAECEGLCVSRAPAAHHQPLVGLAAAGHMAGPANGVAGANAVCDEAKDTGTCSDFSTKWFYNNADGTCTRFHYGGCGGTGNRFDTEGDCKAACQNHQDACSLPMVAGPCNGKTTYFYYNQASGACESFVFGGCLGNTNRFATIEECQARCGRK